MSEPPALHPETIAEILDRHRVEYVLVGGFAANLHGAVRPTQDMDVTPQTTVENLERLAAALQELGAGIRVDELPEGIAFDTSAEALRGIKMLNLRSPHGDIDLTFEPAGFPHGYDDLISHAEPHMVGSIMIKVAAIGDLILSKETAARAKDLVALPELYQLAAQKDGR